MSASATYAELANSCHAHPPAIAIVLGSGLASVAQGMATELSVPYQAVPGLSVTGVAGHRGVLSVGIWVGKKVLLFEGRNHFYEGYPWSTVLRSVELAHQLGASKLLLTNASGGIHDLLGPGSFLAVRDHMQWTHPNWWRLPGPGGLAGGRPSPYSTRLLEILQRTAEALDFELMDGIYCQVTGPNYETPAEVRAIRNCGADAVGMSTAREIELGYALGMECVAISCVANRAAGLSAGTLSHADVIQVIQALAARLGKLIDGFLSRLD